MILCREQVSSWKKVEGEKLEAQEFYIQVVDLFPTYEVISYKFM